MKSPVRRLVTPMLCALTLSSLLISPVTAKPKYSTQEKVPCATCHVKAGKPELNDVGKCYKAQPDDKKDLATCQKDPKK